MERLHLSGGLPLPSPRTGPRKFVGGRRKFNSGELSRLEDASAHATMLFQKSKTVRKALKRMQSDPSEFENFNRTMTQLMSVPHSEIQAALEAEKAAKKNNKKAKD